LLVVCALDAVAGVERAEGDDAGGVARMEASRAALAELRG
jgi:hypothetical protein